MIGGKHAEEVDSEDSHAKSSKPNVKTASKSCGEVKFWSSPMPELDLEKELTWSRSPFRNEKSFDWHPNKEFKRNELFIDPSREMSVGQITEGAQEKKEKRIVEKTG